MTTPTTGQYPIIGYDDAYPCAELTPYRQNPRHGDIGAIAASLKAHGQYRPIVANVGTHATVAREVLAGNHTLQAAMQLGWSTVAVTWVDVDDDAAARIVVVDNRTNDLASYDDSELADLLGHLAAQPAGLNGTGFSQDSYEDLLSRIRANAELDAARHGQLVAAWGVPPFTVLDRRQGYWQERRRYWSAFGFDEHHGREDRLTFTATLGSAMAARIAASGSSTSVFDPVLAELAYRWFCPPGGHIFDPFAGGATRGAVAAILGRHYTGTDISAVQIAANQKAITNLDLTPLPEWRLGDARHTHQLDHPAHLVFTCPPYYDLEQYSDDPDDLSNLPDADFDAAIHTTVANAVTTLDTHGFSVWVIGNTLAKDGHVRDLRTVVTEAHQAAGMNLHADYVIISPGGSAPLRVKFGINRRPVRSHQEMVVYLKGDLKEAVRNLEPPTDTTVGNLE